MVAVVLSLLFVVVVVVVVVAVGAGVAVQYQQMRTPELSCDWLVDLAVDIRTSGATYVRSVCIPV